MSHTNVDSAKTYHIDNSTIIYMNEKEQKIEDPVGGINLRGKNVKVECLEIPFVPEYRLMEGKTVLFRGNSLQEVKAKQEKLQVKNSRKLNKESYKDDVVK